MAGQLKSKCTVRWYDKTLACVCFFFAWLWLCTAAVHATTCTYTEYPDTNIYTSKGAYHGTDPDCSTAGTAPCKNGDTLTVASCLDYCSTIPNCACVTMEQDLSNCFLRTGPGGSGACDPINGDMGRTNGASTYNSWVKDNFDASSPGGCASAAVGLSLRPSVQSSRRCSCIVRSYARRHHHPRSVRAPPSPGM